MKRTSAGKQRKVLAARILCSLLLGMYLVSGYNLPVARGEGTAVGPGASAGHDSSTAVGNNAQASGEKSTAVGDSASASGESTVVIGKGAIAEGRAGVAMGNDASAKGDFSFAAGPGSSASSLSSVAIGYGATAKENLSLALVYGAEAGGYAAAAAGFTAKAGGDYSLALGYKANAVGKYAFALGNEAYAGAMNSVAVGSSANAAQGAIAFGSEVSAGGVYSIGVGFGAKPSGEGGVAFGVNSKAGNYGVAVGNKASAGGDYSVAVGHEANASAANSVAFGHLSKAEAENSFSAVGGVTGTAATNSAAIGNGARVTVADTVALGSGSVASREKGATDAYLKGSNTGSAWVSTHNAIAIGDDATVTRQITGVAAGSKDTDAVNVAQLKALGDAKLDKTEFAKLTNSEGNGRVDVIETAVSGITTAVDGKANATLDNITEAGKTVVKDLARETVNVVGDGPVSVAKSDVSGVDTYKVSVKTDGKVESGDKGIVTGGKVYDYLHGDTLSLGKGSEATGTQSIAIGYGNKVSGNNSGAFGDPNTVSGSGSYAIGNNNTISGDNTFVLGSNVNTGAKNAVVLGDGSEGADNAVSVGAKGKERQIKNVADGTDDTDAVNVVQLKALGDAKLDKTEFAKLTNSEGNGRVDVIETAVSGITTAVDGKANATLDNITEAGKTVVKDLARETVNVVGDGPVSVAKSDVSGVDTYKVSVKTDGKVESGDKGIVTGGKVYDYLHGDTLSLGKGSEATGTQSIAIGYGNKVSGNNSGAFGDPNTVSGSGSYAIGNNNTISGDNTFVLGSNVKTGAKNAVVLGDGSEGADNAVSVGAKGKERQIKNVAPGTDDSDATTVKQVKEMIEAGGGGADLTPVNHRIDNLDSKVNKIGAGAAALAALHPMDTDGKFSMAAGFGNYRDANAMALGLFYRPNDQVMFSMGGSLGNGENMINAGVSFALDKGVTTGKAAMAKKIAVQDAKIAMLEGENAEQKAKIRNQDVEIAALKEALARIEAKLGK